MDVNVSTYELAGNVYTLVVLRDISSQLAAQAALKESEERYRSLVELSPDAIFVHVDGRFVFANPAGARLLGAARPEDLHGRPILESVHPDHRESVRERVRRIRTAGELAPPVEEVFVRLDGSPVDVEVAGTPCIHEGRSAVQVVARDISERKRAQDELHRANLHLESVFRALPDLFFRMHSDGTIVDFKAGRTGDLFVAPARFLGRTMRSVLPEEAGRLLEAAMARALAEGIATVEYTLPMPGGERAFEARLVPLGEDELIALIRDITDRRQAVEALRRSEERWRTVVDNEPECVKQLDREGRLLDMNPAGLAMIQATLEQVRGKRAVGLVAEEDRAAFEEMTAAVFRGETRYLVFDMIGLQGRRLTLETTSAPLRESGPGGGVQAMLGVTRDITERKRAEDAIRESEAMLRESQRVANLGHYALDLAAGTWTGSAMLDEVFGIGPDYPRDVAGWAALVHPDDREWLVAYLQDRVIGRGLPFDKEYRIRRASDGVERWVHGLGRVEHAPDGKSRKMFGVIQDITQRKQTEDRLARLLERHELATRAGGIGVWDWNPVTGEVVWDDRLYELFGLSPAQSVDYGRWLTAIHPEDRAQVEETVRRALGGEIPYDTEFRVLRPDGGVRVLKAFAQVLRDPTGRPIRMTGVNFDVTERKAAEAERIELERRLLHAQKLESLGVLAGGIAHDFNNLLMAVLGNLDLAAQFLSPASPALANLEQAMQATRRGADLTRQMLAYSGKGRFVVAPVDLNELVRENSELFRTAIPRSVRLSLALAPHPALIQADPGQLQQVVMNLITNAAEAIGDRPGLISLSTGVVICDRDALERSRLEVKPEPGAFAYLEVADSGCGMDADTEARLFDPFFTTKFTGRGLGMSAVLGIVRGHGGAITTESSLGRGTVIRVLFPSRGEEAAAILGLAARAAGGQAMPRHSGSILVVDDDETVRALVEHFVRSFGFGSLAAANGEEALSLFDSRSGEIVCVILDLTMPGMSGVDTFRALRRRRGDLPVLIASGFGEEDAMQRFGDASPDGFIQKPYRMAELRARVLQLVERAAPASDSR